MMDLISVDKCNDFIQGLFSNLVAVNVGLFGALIAVAVFVFGIKYWLDSVQLKNIAKKAAEETTGKTEEKLLIKSQLYMDEQMLLLFNSWYKSVLNLEKQRRKSKNKKDMLVFILNEIANRMIRPQKFRYYVFLLETYSDCLNELVKEKIDGEDYSSVKESINAIIESYDNLNKDKEEPQVKNIVDLFIKKIKEDKDKL